AGGAGDGGLVGGGGRTLVVENSVDRRAARQRSMRLGRAAVVGEWSQQRVGGGRVVERGVGGEAGGVAAEVVALGHDRRGAVGGVGQDRAPRGHPRGAVDAVGAAIGGGPVAAEGAVDQRHRAIVGDAAAAAGGGNGTTTASRGTRGHGRVAAHGAVCQFERAGVEYAAAGTIGAAAAFAAGEVNGRPPGRVVAHGAVGQRERAPVGDAPASAEGVTEAQDRAPGRVAAHGAVG